MTARRPEGSKGRPSRESGGLPDPLPPVDAIVVGASAGGVDALFELFRGIPSGWRVPVATVLHLPEDHVSRLAEIFRPRVAADVVEARPGEALAAGTLYFAPPGYHLLIEPDMTFSLSCDPPVMFSRPSIDVLFESAADACGERLAGFVLTGANIDGAAGLAAVKARGGLAVVQDPARAAHATMPAAALAAARPHAVLPIAGLNRLLTRLLHP